MRFQQPICLLYRLRVITTLGCGMATAFKLLQKAMHGTGMKATMLVGNDYSFIPSVWHCLWHYVGLKYASFRQNLDFGNE